MALDALSATTHRKLMPVMTDNVFTSTPLLMLFVRRLVLVDGGASFGAPIRISRNAAGSSYSGADPIPVYYDSANTIGAEWNWCQYGRILGLTGLDDVRNSGIRSIINLIRTSLESIEMELREDMGTDLYGDGTGNANKVMVGLRAVVDDGTNVVTYGNISRTVYVNWKANYSANGGVGRALTLSLMNTNFDNASKDNDRPGVILGSHGLFLKYLGLLQPGMQFSDARVADAGFQNLTYMKRPVIVDDQIPTTPLHRMFFLNLKYFTFYASSKRKFMFVPFQRVPGTDTVQGAILFAGALACTSPRMQAQVVDLDPAL